MVAEKIHAGSNIIAPFNGGFFAWVEINWSSPLNVRFDIFVDPSPI